MVRYPSSPQNQLAKTIFPFSFRSVVVEAVVLVSRPFGDIESVSGRPHSYDWLSSHQEIIDVFHLVVSQVTEAGSDNHQICISERFRVRDVRLVIGIHDTWLLRILRKEHSALKPMVSR